MCRTLLCLFACLLLAGCSDDLAPDADPAEVRYRLASPRAAEGGVMVRVDRALEDAPWSPGGRTETVVEGGSTTIAVVRPEPGPIEIRLSVPPGVEPPELTLLQVVAPDNRLRADLSAYAFEVVR